MKKLRIKFWQNENVVMMKVLEQDERLRSKREIFKDKNFDITISSNIYPAMYSHTLFIRGGRKETDNLVCSITFNSIKDATDYIGKCQKLINNYNMNLEEIEIDEVIKSFIFE